jgi:N-acetylglucosamine kinase-like BadF-type ATPase
MQYVLAVDGGGTKTHIVCATENGEEVGQGLSGPTNLTSASTGEASYNLIEGIRQATEKLPEGWQVKKIVMGLAGLDTPSEITNATHFFSEALGYLPIQNIVLVNDIVIGLRSGTDNPNAVTLIAGTGSNCYGKNAEGDEAKSGGMDFLLADEGSGYAIGRTVLREAVRSFDGREQKTLLEKLVCDHFHIATIAELKTAVYYPLLNKAQVAELSKECAQAQEAGDEVAMRIFDKAVADLYSMVAAVVKKIQIIDREADCVLVGGILSLPYVQKKFSESLLALCPKMHIVSPQKPPVYGALKMALDV